MASTFKSPLEHCIKQIMEDLTYDILLFVQAVLYYSEITLRYFIMEVEEDIAH